MFLIAKGKNAQFARATRVRVSGPPVPSLDISATSFPENTAPGTTLGVAVPRNATNPGPVSIAAQDIANAIAMTGDGITYAVGSAGGPTGTLNFEAGATFTVTFQYTNDVGGPAEEVLQFTRTFTLTDVADGPTTTGATTDLETMIGAAQVGTDVTGDLRDLFVSPTSQALTFAVSHGTIDVDGYSWTWTPDTAGSATVSVTATDEDGQDLVITHTPDVAAAPPPNNAPVAGDITLTFVVPPPAAGVAPSNTVAPAITGTLKIGSVLSASVGTWTGDAPITYARQWQRSDDGSTGWADISGATGSTYTLVAADDGKYLRAIITATNATGSDTATSNVTGQITYQVPTNSVLPAISGTEQVGQTLTSTSGTWANSPSGYAYQWQVSDDGSTGWSNISGATSSTYTLQAAEAAKYVRCVVTATNSGGGASANSAASGAIAAAATGVAVSGTTGSPGYDGAVSDGGNTWEVYTFTTSGSITFSAGGTVEYLVIGGGGGGGSVNFSAGGGGGAGGALQSSFSASAATYDITVGAGGVGGNNAAGAPGGDSLIALNGGAEVARANGGGQGDGGSSGGSTGGNGGSGGGGRVNTTGGTGTSGQGSNGGNGNNSGTAGNRSGGGGGGQSAAGATAPATAGGAGGAGLTTTMRTGSSETYAGGGGGGSRNTGGAASHGGGAGGSNVAGTAGAANTGGGGGGAGNSNVGGDGGSGIVVVRFLA